MLPSRTARIPVSMRDGVARDRDRLRAHAEAERLLSRIEQSADEIRDMLRESRGERDLRGGVRRIFRDACDLDDALASLFDPANGGEGRDDS